MEAVDPIIRPPQDDPAKWPSLALSATVHLLLIAALFLGVQWKSKPPSSVEVEVWRAAPAPTVVSEPEPKPEVKPVAKPEPRPEPKPEPKPLAKPEPRPEPRPIPKPAPAPEPKPEPRPVAKAIPRPEPKVEPKPPVKPDIALKEDKKLKELPKTEEPKVKEPPKKEEPKVKEQPKKEEPKAKEPPKKEEPKVKELPKKEEPKAKEPPKKEEPKAKDAPRKEDTKPKESPAKEEVKPKDVTKPDRRPSFDDELSRETKQLQQQKAEQKALQDLRARADAEARQQKQLQAEQSSADNRRALAEYKERIRGRIRGNISLPPGIQGNPEAVFEVTQLPSGDVLDVKVRRSSGNPALDAAVERAIRKTSPLPKPPQPELFSRVLSIPYKPHDD